FLDLFDLVVRGLIEVFQVITIKRGRCGGDSLGSSAALQEFEFPEALLQAFAASAQRLVDGLGGGCKPPLENSERESDRPRSFIVSELFGAVKLLTYVISDFAVELRLGIGKPVRHGVGSALREKRLAVELEQVFLHHPAHQVRDFHLVNAVTEAPLETVAIEQRQKQLEILLLAVVRSSGHQEKMPCQA